MGNARWSNDAYATYASTTNYRSQSIHKVFSSRMSPELDPANVRVGKGERQGQMLRESIISDENPNPTPIILGLDVTGSMGGVAHRIATDGLPKLMTQIHETGVVSDPHVMFMGIDDVFAQGHGALQVSYFEPDLRIIEQLRKMWIVGNGGGNGSESYDLAWYFAGNFTYLDSLEQQGRKGFLFTIGDEPPPFQNVTSIHLKKIFGNDYQLREENHPIFKSISPAESLEMAQKKYHVFHITVCHGSINLSHKIHNPWTEMLGNNALILRNENYLTEVVLATMKITNGADIYETIEQSTCPDELHFAFQNALK